jgi:hypothetical protein
MTMTASMVHVTNPYQDGLSLESRRAGKLGIFVRHQQVVEAAVGEDEQSSRAVLAELDGGEAREELVLVHRPAMQSAVQLR